MRKIIIGAASIALLITGCTNNTSIKTNKLVDQTQIHEIKNDHVKEYDEFLNKLDKDDIHMIEKAVAEYQKLAGSDVNNNDIMLKKLLGIKYPSIETSEDYIKINNITMKREGEGKEYISTADFSTKVEEMYKMESYLWNGEEGTGYNSLSYKYINDKLSKYLSDNTKVLLDLAAKNQDPVCYYSATHIILSKDFKSVEDSIIQIDKGLDLKGLETLKQVLSEQQKSLLRAYLIGRKNYLSHAYISGFDISEEEYNKTYTKAEAEAIKSFEDLLNNHKDLKCYQQVKSVYDQLKNNNFKYNDKIMDYLYKVTE